jgi:hypothetical protein
MWGVSTHSGQLTISWFRGPLTDDEIAQLIKMSKHNTGTDDIRKANYKEVSKEFPHAWCSTFTPPTTDKRGLLLSTCAGGVKGQGLSITFMSPTKALTVDQVKALLDKAGERAR